MLLLHNIIIQDEYKLPPHSGENISHSDRVKQYLFFYTLFDQHYKTHVVGAVHSV